MVFRPLKKLNSNPEAPEQIKRVVKKSYEPSQEELEEEELDEEEFDEEVEEEKPKTSSKQYPQNQQSQPMLTRDEVKDMIVGHLSRAVDLVRML